MALPDDQIGIRTRRALTGSKRHLTPRMVNDLRGKIYAGVVQLLPHAIEAAEGTRKWSPTQARIFTALLGKVMPEVSSHHVQVDHTHMNLDGMSRAELLRIAAGDEEEDVVDVDFEETEATNSLAEGVLDDLKAAEDCGLQPEDEPACVTSVPNAPA